MIRSLIITIAIYLAVSTGISYWVYQNAFQSRLEIERARGEVRLSEATSRLRGQLDVYRALANLVGRDSELETVLKLGSSTAIKNKLSQLSLTYGAGEINLADVHGRVVASSDTDSDKKRRPYSSSLINAALNGRLGSEQAIEENQRLFRFSMGVRESDGGGTIIGAIVVSVDLAALEFEWPVSPEPIIFLDADNRIFSANRPELLLLRADEGPEQARLPLEQITRTGDTPLWRFGTGDISEVQVLSHYVPHLNLTAQILLDTVDARATAQLRLMLAAALLLALGLVGTVFLQQRRRLTLESQHSATLEARVESRTAELRAAQDELVEASKLAALGRLSAGVSHELNQPLATIMNFAENGRRFVERGRPEKAEENLGEITKQVRRITRIIGNLRAFARQEITPTEVIDLGEVVNDAIELSKADLEQAKVQLSINIPSEPVMVIGGLVRLEQVVLNLISNAVDAMQTKPEKVLTVALTASERIARIAISDTGGGIEEPDRVFEPFYTTKELGASKGLGMGLALSHGIIGLFEGQLSCKNIETGAQFVIALPLVEDSK